jgi:hypothetical protein
MLRESNIIPLYVLKTLLEVYEFGNKFVSNCDFCMLTTHIIEIKYVPNFV